MECEFLNFYYQCTRARFNRLRDSDLRYSAHHTPLPPQRYSAHHLMTQSFRYIFLEADKTKLSTHAHNHAIDSSSKFKKGLNFSCIDTSY